MARRSKAKVKANNKVIGIALMTVGVGLGAWGYQKSGGIGSQLSNALTGSHSDNVMLLYIAGAICIAIGIYFIVKR